MKLNKGFLVVIFLLFIIILGFNSVSAADSSDLTDDKLDLGIDSVSSSIDDKIEDSKLISSSIEETIDDSCSLIKEDGLKAVDGSHSDLIKEDGLKAVDGSHSDLIKEGYDSNTLEEGSDSVYVSLNGNDDNDGSDASPVRTVERAIQLASAENGSHKVFVREGSYEVFDIDLDYIDLTIEGSGIGKTIFDGIGYTGGMFSIYQSNLTIKNLSIIDAVNTASSGAAFTNMGNLTIENINVSGCTVKNANGGVIYSVGNLNIFNSSFSNNQVIPTDTDGNGGVIYADGYMSSLSYPPSLNISGCEFKDNVAKGNTFGGGAIYMQYVDGFKSIENSRFINNQALSGGAIFMQNSMGNFLMNNVSFIKNKATGTVSNYGGGAICLIGKTDGKVGNLSIINSEFINNSAVNTRGGGAILDRNVDLNISNSFIYNNKDTAKGLSIFKDTTVHYPNGGKVILEDNWWGSNSAPKLDKISINRWVVLDLSAEFLDPIDNDLETFIEGYDKNLKYYALKALLNSYNDGSSISDEKYHPFNHQFSFSTLDGVFNKSNGVLENNVAEILFSSHSRENIISLKLDNQSLNFDTNSIISNISAQKLQKMIDNALDGDEIDLGNCNCENISNIIISKNLSIIGNNQTSIKSSLSGGPIFSVDMSSYKVDSLNLSNLKFLTGNGDVVLLVNAANSTDPMEICIPSIGISDVSLEKKDAGVVGESVTFLEISSERGLLATDNPVSIENCKLFDGVKSFKFNVSSIEGENGISIPKGGSIGIEPSNGSIIKEASLIVSKAMKTVAVNTKVNGKKAGKFFSVTLKDKKGNPLSAKQVLISLNGKIYKRTTNSNGVASLKIALSKKGTYPIVISFLGDERYNGSFAVSKVKVNPQKVKLAVSNKGYKAKVKSKVLTASLKASNKKAIKGKKIVFAVNKRKYTGKTNAKGIAKVKVNLSKRGTYKFTVKFAGDSTFKKISKKGKIVIR